MGKGFRIDTGKRQILSIIGGLLIDRLLLQFCGRGALPKLGRHICVVLFEPLFVGIGNAHIMKGLVSSVRAGGVHQPALVRPREGGGYEIIAGHRRQRASELAGYKNMPCIVRNMTDDEAVLAMTDDNLRHRETILPSEKAAALKQQYEAIKHQGTRGDGADLGKLSLDKVGERNGMSGKTVQRYIYLNDLVPELKQFMDGGKLSFTPAVEISRIRPDHQKYIAVSIEGQQSSPSKAQAKKLREMDEKNQLNPDVKGPGYERWAKIYNLKQMAAALQFLQENGLTDYDALAERTAEVVDRAHALAGELRGVEERLASTTKLMGAVVDYAKTRPVFDGYKAARYSKKYLAEHEEALASYRAAKAAINDILDGAKLPRMEALKKERRELSERKKKLYAQYRAAQQEMREAVAVKANVDHLLGLSDGRENKAQER